MAYNIGDRVLVGEDEGVGGINREAVITDRFYSEKSNKFFLRDQIQGQRGRAGRFL